LLNSQPLDLPQLAHHVALPCPLSLLRRATASKRTAFREFLALNELCFGVKLSVLLNAPVTRLAQYLMYLGTLHEKLDAKTPAAEELEKASLSIQSVTDDVAVTLRDTVRGAAVRSVAFVAKIAGFSVSAVAQARGHHPAARLCRLH
jgi:hypothetical protein